MRDWDPRDDEGDDGNGLPPPTYEIHSRETVYFVDDEAVDVTPEAWAQMADTLKNHFAYDGILATARGETVWAQDIQYLRNWLDLIDRLGQVWGEDVIVLEKTALVPYGGE